MISTTSEPEVAILVYVPQVARLEPAIAGEFPTVRVCLDIAREDVILSLLILRQDAMTLEPDLSYKW